MDTFKSLSVPFSTPGKAVSQKEENISAVFEVSRFTLFYLPRLSQQTAGKTNIAIDQVPSADWILQSQVNDFFQLSVQLEKCTMQCLGGIIYGLLKDDIFQL